MTSDLADLIPFEVKHVFYSAPFEAGAITCLPEQTWTSAMMRIPKLNNQLILCHKMLCHKTLSTMENIFEICLRVFRVSNLYLT